jgi:hypothetical protein
MDQGPLYNGSRCLCGWLSPGHGQYNLLDCVGGLANADVAQGSFVHVE